MDMLHIGALVLLGRLDEAPYQVTKGIYPEVDPYNVIIPIT